MILSAFTGCATSPSGLSASVPHVQFSLQARPASDVTLVVMTQPPGKPGLMEIRPVRTGSGAWSTYLELPPGKYSYFFLVDGSPTVGQAKARMVKDDFGGVSGLFTIVRMPDGELEIY